MEFSFAFGWRFEDAYEVTLEYSFHWSKCVSFGRGMEREVRFKNIPEESESRDEEAGGDPDSPQIDPVLLELVFHFLEEE